MPYNGIIYSDEFDEYVPYYKGVPFIMHSPAESLETVEMETLLSVRGAIPAQRREDAKLILINRLYLPCINNIPGLTDHKRRDSTIILFGSYLDYETVGKTVKPTFGTGLKLIFPNGGRICFTVDHLLEHPLHIKNILAYTVALC
jgi:hypothetical protein